MARPLRVAGWLARLVGGVLYAGWVALMIATPLVGFWLASSLAAYRDASQWLALVVGLLLFPIVPVGWELFYVWRRSRRETLGKPILTRLDRLVLRTLIIDGLFLGLMLWRAPHTSVRALAVRGDWILDGHHGPIATRARSLLLGFADRLDRRLQTSNDIYGSSDKPPPEPTSDPTPPTLVDLAKPVQPKDPNGWPRIADADAIVKDIPDSAQTSVDAVGAYFAERIKDPRELAKALHDYVVMRLHYDVATSQLTGEAKLTRTSQAAEDVFVARTAVCEGYARLMVALGKAAGLEIAYVTGYIRDARRNVDATASDDTIQATLDGYRHAWNAVKIDGSWLFIDATWDDPVTADGAQQLSSTYLFTPPQLFVLDHLPQEPAWQLLATPIGVGEFARQPLLNATIGTLGIALQAPVRSQITTDGEVEVEIANPFGAHLMAEVEGNGVCGEPTAEPHAKLTCHVPSGQHEIRMFGTKDANATSFGYFGSIMVNSR